MSPSSNNNIAARVGGWSARHWKTAVFLWVGFVVASVVIGGAAGTKQTAREDMNVGETRRAEHLLTDTGLRVDPQTEYVIIKSTTRSADDPSFRSVVDEMIRALDSHRASFTGLTSPYDDRSGRQVSPDGHTVFVEFTMKGEHEAAIERIDPIVAATESVQAKHPDFYVGQAGAASTGKAFEKLIGKQLEDAGVRSVPLTLLVLFLVFGAAVAAVIPVVLALTAVLASLGLLAALSHLVPVDPNVSVVVLLIGLAVGVDYSLFYIKRRREEREAGRDSSTALASAAATSGRTILISGATVLIAMAGMLFSGDMTFMSFSIGTMAVVAVAVIGSLTVLPAVLAKLGDNVDRGRIPYVSRALRERRNRGVWQAIVRSVMRRPKLSAAAATAVLIVLALPALKLTTAQSGLDVLPADTPELKALLTLEEAFPGGIEPATVVINAPNASTGELRAAVGRLATAAVEAHVTTRPLETEFNGTGTSVRVNIALVGDGLDQRSEQALHTLRNEVLPRTVGQIEEAEYAVAGLTAASYDYGRTMKRALPVVFLFVLALAFILLLASFRSLVVAGTAIVMNLLSVAAAYGVLAVTFQNQWAEGLLGFESNGAIAHWLPLFLFVILFGLSMDYHVFILSRIREGFDRGLSTDHAVERAISSTAGVVTSAAIVMVGAFSLFATMPLRDLKEMGVGLAVAVLIDATIVRAILLPSVMTLLGDRNWYLPRWLEWLPRIDHGGEAPTATAPPGSPERQRIATPVHSTASRRRPAAAPPRRARDARARPRLETLIFRGGTAIALVHAVDDAWLDRQPGVGLGQHALAAMISLAAGISAIIAYPALRPAFRSGIALIFGVFAVVNGALHVIHVTDGGASGSDVTGILALVAGIVLIVVGLTIPFIHRGEGTQTRTRRWVNRVIAVVVGALALYALVLPISVALVDTHKYREPIGSPPSATYEAVSFVSSDGLELAGWYHPSRNRAAVVVVHGGGGDRTGAVAHAELLARHGFGVLVYDSRGRGESEGSPVGFGWGWPKDVAGALAFLRDRPDVDPERIGGLGLSRGADTLIRVAAEDRGLKAVVSDGATGGTFADYRNLRKEIEGAPYFLAMYTAARVFSGESPGEPLKDAVARISPTPLLLISTGGNLPVERDFNRIYAEAAREPVDVWVLPNVNHTAAIRERPGEYERRVVGFLDSALGE